jgi:hypothetical protein
LKIRCPQVVDFPASTWPQTTTERCSLLMVRNWVE